VSSVSLAVSVCLSGVVFGEEWEEHIVSLYIREILC